MDSIQPLTNLQNSCKFGLRQHPLPTLLQISKWIHMPHRKNHEPTGLLGFILWGASLERAGRKGQLQLTNLILLIFTSPTPVQTMGLRVFHNECSLSCANVEAAHKLKSSVEEGLAMWVFLLHRPSGSIHVPGDHIMSTS